MRIGIGCDHAGFEVKETVINAINDLGHSFIDYGTYDNKSVDYPDFALKVANEVISKEVDYGILMCGTGIGICITANKVRGIRCAHVTDTFSAKASRGHNDANILAVGSRITPKELISEIVKVFLSTEFEGERHLGRINKISDIEKMH